jgi:hypothetical protein
MLKRFWRWLFREPLPPPLPDDRNWQRVFEEMYRREREG